MSVLACEWPCHVVVFMLMEFFSSALVVNIGRPWLYGELFSDAELDVVNNVL
jgi:hypothetical protein